jgi:integrase
MPRFPRPFFKRSHRAYYVQLDGRQVRLAEEKDEALRAYHDLMASRERPAALPRPAGAPLFVEIADRFLDFCKEHRAGSTYGWYREKLQLFAAEVAGRLAVDQLRPYHLDDWFAKHPNWSSGTRHNAARAVMRALSWARKRGRIQVNPLTGYEKPRAGKRTAVVSPAEFEELLAAVRQPEFRDLLAITWETGARPQESLLVEARHVDLDRGRWVFPAEESKGEQWPRIVYLSAKALDLTRRLVLEHPSGPLFRNSDGRPWTTDAVNCAFVRVQVTLGMRRLKAQGLVPPRIPRLRGPARRDPGRRADHDRLVADRRRELLRLAKGHGKKYCLYALRHSWATHALSRGVDALTVAILLGHRDPATLAKTYQHLTQDPGYLQEAARRVRT